MTHKLDPEYDYIPDEPEPDDDYDWLNHPSLTAEQRNDHEPLD